MQTQQDNQVRIVALENLSAMCARESGTCHRYWIEKATKTRVWVGYSNPNEYGSESPMFAVFPCYPSGWSEDSENPRVVLEILRVVHDSWDGEGWQSFHPITDCPTLWRNPVDGCWQTEAEISIQITI